MKVDTLRALEAAATPGPWHGGGDGALSRDQTINGRTSCSPVASFGSTPDAHFVAAARNALPALLDVAEAIADLGASGPFLRTFPVSGVDYPEDSDEHRVRRLRAALDRLEATE